MSPRFDGDAHGPPGGEVSLEGLWGGAQPAFLHDLATVLVDEAEVGVFVAEVQSGRRLWMLFATVHGGPILLPFGPLKPVEPLQTQGYCAGGRPSHLPRIQLLGDSMNKGIRRRTEAV